MIFNRKHQIRLPCSTRADNTEFRNYKARLNETCIIAKHTINLGPIYKSVLSLQIELSLAYFCLLPPVKISELGSLLILVATPGMQIT